MAEMMRHTGILNNTGKNVVVVFMSLPDDPEHALVIDTDALPDQFNESLRKIVESVDGQESKNLADILSRRMSPDGSNITLLEKFHRANRLQKVAVENVTMVPRKGINWPLKDILAAMLQEEENTPADLSDLDPETRSQVISEMGKFNVHAANMEGTTASGQKAEAISLLKMAELLESDANVKRQQAYRMDPSLLKTTKKVENPKVTTKAEAKATTKAKAEQATRKVTNINISDMTDEQLAENLQTISKSLKNATKQKA
jgi:hypothetical protein